MRLRITSFAFLTALCFLFGCGGGGGESATRSLKVKIEWAALSRQITAPSEAVSATILFKDAHPNGGDVVVPAKRDPAQAGAYTGEYDTEVKVGTWEMNARFFATPDPSSGETPVAVVQTPVSIPSASNAAEVLLTTEQTIAAAEVTPGQSLRLGEEKPLNFVARNAGTALVALSPAATANFTVVNGSDKLLNINGQMFGIAAGTAQVTATVNGVTGAPQTVAIAASPSLDIDPPAATLSVGDSQQFRARGSAATAVTWSVVHVPGEGTTGGSVTADGHYTAPAMPGTDYVVATSLVNQFGTVAQVTVQAGDAQITIR